MDYKTIGVSVFAIGAIGYWAYRPFFIVSVRNNRYQTVKAMMPFASRKTINAGFEENMELWKYDIIIPGVHKMY